MEDIGFLTQYKGIVVKDGTDLYNHCGRKRVQCLSHILRYLKGVYDFNGHEGAKEMAKLLSGINEKRNNYIDQGKEKFEKDEAVSIPIRNKIIVHLTCFWKILMVIYKLYKGDKILELISYLISGLPEL